VYNVPMALDSTCVRTEGIEPAFAMVRNNRHVADCKDYIVGPMPASDFVETFLPLPEHDTRGQLSAHNAFKAVPRDGQNVSDIYKPLNTALNQRTRFKSRCPGFAFDITINRSIRPSRLGYTKPHICCFTKENKAILRRTEQASRTEFAYAELFFEIKPRSTGDYFSDPPPGPHTSRADHNFLTEFESEKDEALAARALGLHIAFATEIFARQHRVFLFTISMSGSFVRLLRWDRSGCIVSSAFSIHEHPDILIDFLWRFSQTSQAGRGHDLSVYPANAAEEGLVQNAITEHVRQQLEIEGDELDQAVTTHYQPGHVTAMYVLHEPFTRNTDNLRRFLVSRPVISPLSLDGHGTRGFWALDIATGLVVFLKDTWRRDSRAESEGEVLQRIHDHGVQNTPVLVCHGPVPRQVPPDATKIRNYVLQITETNRYHKAAWACLVDNKKVRVSKRQHYRLVTTPVGYTLSTVRSTEELLHATYDVFTVMRAVLSKDSRIHRDISVGNIILVKEPGHRVRKGYLIDWDSSDNVDHIGEALHAGRAGTWAFTSMRMLNLRFADAKHAFEDDMESLLYVVLYCALHYLPHNLQFNDLAHVVRSLFDMPLDTTHGGDEKVANAMFRVFTGEVQFGSPALHEWLNTVMDYHMPPDELKEAYADKWKNPDHLDAFWAEFLRTHTLERNDRVPHKISMSGFYDIDSTTSSTHRSVHTSSPAKRPANEPAHASAPPAKRARRS
ncbi:hypothetical protein BD413DRAFT_429883, partial [Trametes elegans]